MRLFPDPSILKPQIRALWQAFREMVYLSACFGTRCEQRPADGQLGVACADAGLPLSVLPRAVDLRFLSVPLSMPRETQRKMTK